MLLGLPFLRSISIHTLCEEGDSIISSTNIRQSISIHTLCEEGDEIYHFQAVQKFQFQSTPSVKRATKSKKREHKDIEISIHTLCEEGDVLPSAVNRGGKIFQSTPSVKRATAKFLLYFAPTVDFNPHPL